MKLRNLLIKLGQHSARLVSLLSLAIAASFSTAFASDLNWNFTFSPSDIVLSPCGEYTVVSLADGANTRDAIGAPAIPAKFVNILLPDGATDVSVTATGSLELLASDVMPWPVQRVAPKSKVQPPFTAPDAAAYSSASPLPVAVATFEGLHEMQGSTFVSVRVNPIVYVGSEKALYYRPSVSVKVSYTASAASRAKGGTFRDAGVSSMVNALVVNPTASSSPARRSATRDAAAVDYLIITSSSLSSAFQNLADYRSSAAGGDYRTLVVTKEAITSSYTGDDDQMKIRNCIIDYVNNHGTTYVVLGGDDSVVPDRDTYAAVPDDDTYEYHMPTDLYYSDLTGTWKTSGNSNFGVVAAKVDMSPDVIVGRIPVRNASQLNGYLAKVRAFEADLTHTRNSIILGGPAAWCRYYGNKRPSDDVTGDGHAAFRTNHDYVSDSEMWLRRLYRDGIAPYWNNIEQASSRTINLACDAITSWDTSKCGDKALSASNLKTWLNNGYTHLMFSGHGYPQGWGMETSTEYSTTQAAAQTNLTAFVYTDACLTGAFDEDGYKSYGITVDVGTRDQDTYDSEPCLGEAFIRNANGGSLVHMGCARYGWGDPDYLESDPDDTDADGYYTKCTASNTSDGGPSTVYAYKFYKRLYEPAAIAENRTLGKAFAMSKADMISQCSKDGCERWIQYGLNYLGDPAIALYPYSSLVAPKELAISDVTTTSFKASWAAVDGADSYQVDVIKGSAFESSNGEPVLNADFASATDWTLSGTTTYTRPGYYGQDTPSIKFDGTGDYAISPDFGSGVRLQFWAFGNNGSGSTFKISGLVNGTWTVLETVSINEGGNTYELDLPSGTSQLRFDFTKVVNCALDDVVVYGPSVEAGEYVAGWNNTTVNATSANVTGLMPGTEYAVRVRAVNSEGSSGWSAVATATTAAGESAPVWTEFLSETNIYVSEEFELNIGNYVSAIPTPTLSMVASESEDATFDTANGIFRFTPSAIGTYSFTFRAENIHGSVDATFTVNVANPPVTIPTLAVNEDGMTPTSASVLWTACDGVTDYTLQLATDDMFTAGNPGSSVTLVENSATSITVPAGWTYNISSNSKSYLILFEGNDVITEVFDASACTDLELSLSMRTYGGIAGSSNTLLVEYSSDKSNWTQLGELTASNNQMTKKSLDISAVAGISSAYLRFSAPGATSSRGVGIKEILISGTNVVGGSLIFTTTVSGTAYTFTELETGTTYFARVKGESDWSNTVSFVISEEDPTSIRNSQFNTDDAEPWFTLNGVRLLGKPVQKGIYIHGSKKEAIK